jgi:hypothetical protein
MLFRKITVVYFEKKTRETHNTVREQNGEFLDVEADCALSKHCALKG